MISVLINRLVVAKLDFNKMHNIELNQQITQIFDIGIKYTNLIEELMHKNKRIYRESDKGIVES